MRGIRPQLVILTFLAGVSAATRTDAGEPITLRGITEPVHDVVLSATVAGTVRTLHGEEGDPVSKGDVLLELDGEMERLEAERRKLIWDSKIEVESAKARVDTVQTDLAATRRLFDSTQSVSEEELRSKTLEHALAVAEWERLKSAEQREEIEYRMAVERLQQKQITAPIDGTITQILIEEGENCEPNQPLIRVVNATQFYCTCNTDAAAASGLRVGQPVEIELEDQAVETNRIGQISFISPVVDPASGLQEIKAIFANQDGAVHPGVAGAIRTLPPSLTE